MSINNLSGYDPRQVINYCNKCSAHVGFVTSDSNDNPIRLNAFRRLPESYSSSGSGCCPLSDCLNITLHQCDNIGEKEISYTEKDFRHSDFI